MSVDICPILRGVPDSMQSSLLTKLLSGGNVSASSMQSHLSSLLPLLSSSQDQSSALQSLLPLLRSSGDLCSSNCEKLLPLLSKILSRPGLSLNTLQMVFQCLTLLVVNSSTNSEVGKLVSTSAPSFINSVMSTKTGLAMTSSLQLLAVLMSRYPGSCGHARSRIQDKLVKLLGKEGEEVNMELLGKCFSLLPQVGGGGREGSEHITQYNIMVNSMVSTIHTGLTSLFSHVREFDTYLTSSSATPLALPQAGGGQLERNIVLAMQLDRTMSVLGQLLTRGFPQARVIPVDLLLSIPTRLLSLTLPPGSTPSHYLLSSLLSNLTCSALSLSCHLISTLGSQLLPEAGSINSLIVSGLARVSNPPVRTGLYNLLTAWLEAAGAGSGMEYSAKQLFNNMRGDIIPSKDKMLLERSSSNKKQRKHGGKKGGGGGNGMNNLANLSISTVPSPISVATCSAALTSLSLLVSTTGPWLDKETHSLISSTLLSQLLSPTSPHPLPSLLLSCLANLIPVSSPSHPSPAQICPAVLNLHSLNPALASQLRPAQILLQATAHPARHTLDIQDTSVVSLNKLDSSNYNDTEDATDDVEVTSIGVQTETQSMVPSNVIDDTSKRIAELEEAVRKSKEAEKAARAEIIRKDIELSRAVINAQKRAANEEKANREAKKSKISEIDTSANLSDNLPHSSSNSVDVTSVEAATNKPDESQLSVGEMLEDFSAKLNSNLLPANFAESDSD